MPEQLEIVAHGATAILATWLGLTVAVRASRLPAARVLGLLAGLLVTWSVAIIIERLSPVGAVTVRRVANGFEEIGAFLLIAATLHIAVAISAEGRWSRTQRVTVMSGYALCILMGLPAVLDPDVKFSIAPPHFEIGGIPGEVFGWAWVAIRVVLFGLAITWLVIALRHSDRDVARRRQLQVTLVAVALGALGGAIRFTPPVANSDPWIGVSLVTLALVVAAYAVFAQRIFFPATFAARTFRYSVVIGLLVTGYVSIVIGLDSVVRRVLGVDLPIVAGLVLVATIALFEPMSERLRRAVTGTKNRHAISERMLRALGDFLPIQHGAAPAAQTALERLCRAFRLTGARELDRDGRVTASHGSFDPHSGVALRMPLLADGHTYGSIIFGPKRSGLPYTSDEVDVLRLAAEYLGASRRMAEAEFEQAAALDRLSGERRVLASAGTELQAALAAGATRPAGSDLYVYALGPLKVERGGELVTEWGGAKAGTRQAEAMFAFLFDRGERGASKDEIIELIWEDVDLEHADLAFHRTLGGLRRTLEPGWRREVHGSGISFRNDRYHLDPTLIAWSDVAAFDEEMSAASTASMAGDSGQELLHLERARSLYRGEYLDDCPFYGDSPQVEDQRGLLRGRFVDLLMAIGELGESRGDRPTAAMCYRQARIVNGEPLPQADAALIRVGAAATP